MDNFFSTAPCNHKKRLPTTQAIITSIVQLETYPINYSNLKVILMKAMVKNLPLISQRNFKKRTRKVDTKQKKQLEEL